MTLIKLLDLILDFLSFQFLEQYAIGEQISDLIKEFLLTIRDQLPTEESKEFIQKLNDYINAVSFFSRFSDETRCFYQI